ncbi:MAG: Na+/H+ antiporter subunit E [Draconibacterium sp.]|nr:Na+/H+ antiporter subunit E [Draconibacterium sp.]
MNSLTLNEKLTRFSINWFFLMIVWIAFTTSFAAQELIVGGIATMLISFFTIPLFTCCTFKLLAPKQLFYMVYYLVIFIRELIKSNVDVARRVITPSLPINPGIVKFKSELPTDFAKMILANSITLTPGTLSIDIIDDTFYVHWIDVKTTNPEEAFTEIAETFEKILLKIFK